MRIQRPPKLQISAELLGEWDALQPLVALANHRYFHWDQFRRRPIPALLSHQQIWPLIEMTRPLRFVPFRDVAGQSFGFHSRDEFVQRLHIVDRLAGDFISLDDSGAGVDPLRNRIQTDSHIEEAIATSQIEGAITTRVVAQEMLRTNQPPRDRSQRMIVNGFRTIQLLREKIDRPLTIDFLHQIQTTITEGTLDDERAAGRFRTDADPPIHVIDTRTSDAVYTPPPAQVLQERMMRMINFANVNSEQEPFIHPLIRASILHFWLAYEHPYVDGNGRTARALFYWYMLRSGYWLFGFLTVSRVIHASRMQYYRAFQYVETDRNDLTYFINYMLDATVKAVEELRDRIKRLTDERAQITRSVAASRLNQRQRSFLAELIRFPSIRHTFESYKKLQSVSLLTARHDLVGLLDAGLLVEVGMRRPRAFVAAPRLEKRLNADKSA